jgi:hypothetical protein
MVRYRVLASAALLILFLAACSSSSSTNQLPSLSASLTSPTLSASPAPAGGTTDCASLVTAADVSTIVGETVTGPSSASSNNIPGLQASACAFVAPDGTVGFSFGQGPNAATVQTVFQTTKAAQGGVDVAGVGDSAYFSASTHNLLAIRGTTFVSVGVILSLMTNPAKEQAAAVALAQKVLAGL